MTGILWKNLCDFMCRNRETNQEQNQNNQKFEFDGNSENRLKGIIYELSKEAGGNVADKGIVSVTSSSTNYNFNSPRNAVDFGNKSSFCASENDNFNQWLQYDFKEKKIRPTRYSIKTREDNDLCNPQSWVIEVSNTGNQNDWRLIDKSLKEKSS